MIDKIKQHILEIGEDLVQCDVACNDIENNLARGIPPRCLFLQDWDVSIAEKGIVVIGLNPGKLEINGEENNFYLEKGSTYVNILSYFKKNYYKFAKNGYYALISQFVKDLGINGPILWTEIAHCECLIKDTKLSRKTQLSCSRKFLSSELSVVPNDWYLLGVGRDAFEILGFKYPDRTVLGIPHTNSRGHFRALFNQNQKSPIFHSGQSLTDLSKNSFIWLPDLITGKEGKT